MASLVILANGTVGTTTGYPSRVVFGEGLETAREFPAKGGTLPWGVTLKERVAMQFFAAPETALHSGASLADKLEFHLAAFGSGRRYDIEYEWVPTSARFGRLRAWVFRKRWTEGGDGAWFGPVVRHDNALAAVWLDIDQIAPWAEELLKSPFAQELLAVGSEMWATIQVPTGTDVAAWAQDPNLSIGVALAQIDEEGVYVDYKAKWGGEPQGLTSPRCGGWCGTLRQRRPGDWHVATEIGHSFKKWLLMTAEIYSNGKETHVYFAEDQTQEPKPFVADALPAKPEPMDVTGDRAAVFCDSAALRSFCLRYNVVAEKLWLGLHEPRDNQGGAHILALNAEWAARAYDEGAAPTPPTIGEIPPSETWMAEGISYFFEIGGQKAHAYDKAEGGYSVHLDDGQGNCVGYIRGWVRVPARLRASVPFGITVREVGDTTPLGYNEISIYEDGRIVFPEISR